MKKSILVCLIGMVGFSTLAQKNDEKAIEAVIKNFAAAADKNDAELLSTYLDENYRIVMNRLFGSAAVSVMTKADYLAKIESKEWGGDAREVTVMQIIVNGSTATAHARLKGAKSTFVSLFVLLKDADGKWKLVSDSPIIEA